jgi:glycosyltransferase involved in cell wall biosynthesis
LQTYDNVAVLHVVAPGQVGGLESVVLALTAGQAARGDRVHVAVMLDGQLPEKHAFLESVNTLDVDLTTFVLRPRAYASERARIAELCAKVRPDVVHTHGYRTDVIDSGVARRMGIPTVTTVHGFTGIGGWRGRLYEYLQRRAFRRFDAVVAVSRPLVTLLRNDGVAPDRVHMIPNAYAPGEFIARADARRTLGLGDGFIAGWIGRLSREKAPDVFVEAVDQVEGMSAAIIGSGREAPRNSPRVKMLGQVADAARLMKAFDVLVLSSRTEGTPMVLFEAMAAHVPVVATAVGGVPDVVSDNEALLVLPDRPEALARAIESIRSDPASARLRADAAAKRLATEYAVGPWVERYAAVYRGVR